jgi:hypothetical protein
LAAGFARAETGAAWLAELASLARSSAVFRRCGIGASYPVEYGRISPDYPIMKTGEGARDKRKDRLIGKSATL